MKNKALNIALLLPMMAAASLSAATFADKVSYTFPLNSDGMLSLHNPAGNIEVVGVDGNVVSVTAERISRGNDEATVTLARRLTQIVAAGNPQARVIRTNLPPPRPGTGLTVAVNYIIHVPRGAKVNLSTRTAEVISVSNVSGAVTIANNSGLIRLINVSSPEVNVETINGSILFESNTAPRGNLATVNGNVQIIAPPNSNLNWVAETVGGSFQTSFPLKGMHWNGARFEAGVNSGGPVLRTVSLMGSISLVGRGAQSGQIRSIANPQVTSRPALPPGASRQDMRNLHFPVVEGNFMFTTNVGNIRVDEARQNLKLETGAGDIHVGTVRGFAEILSLGGPLRLGDVTGALRATTKAGDIQVQAARSGGTISTGGGIIRLIFAGGPTRLESGGGDITVRQGNAPLTALTRSGDIFITMDGAARSQKVFARTAKGSVSFNVSRGFGADVDAIVITSDPEANNIRTDMAGLSIQREQVNGKTRIRATGKINGGGERVELVAEEGGIQIMSTTPGVSNAPR